MDFNSTLTIVSAFMLCAYCRAIILIKFPQLSEHFTAARTRGARHRPDPLGDFGLESRQLLCDAVIQAKQFCAQYNPGYYRTGTGKKAPKVICTKWDDSRTSDDNIRNYQRLLPSYRNANLSALRYVPRPLKFGRSGYERVKALQCVNTMTVKWYITYGYMDHFMYLLEDRSYKPTASLRISGLFEPTPVISNRPTKYFSNQLMSSSEDMEQICTIGLNDHIRICGALLDVLNNEGSLGGSIPQINFVRSRRRICLTKMIQAFSKPAKVLRCTFASEEDREQWAPIYALADIREPGAVFVFFENSEGNLYLHARVVKISALLYPVGPKARKVGAKDQISEEISDRGKRKKLRTRKDYHKDAEDDYEMISDDQVRAREVEMDAPEHDQAEHSLEDSDHEDYIMNLLGKGGHREKKLKEGSSRQNETEGKQIKKKESGDGSGKDGEAVRPLQRVRTNRGMKKLSAISYAKSENIRKEKQMIEGSSGEDASDGPGNTAEVEETNKRSMKDIQVTEVRTYMTRWRDRKKQQIGEDDTKNSGKNEKKDTGDDYDDFSEESSEEEDSQDENYNYDKDSKQVIEDEDYEFVRRSKTKHTIKGKKRTKIQLERKSGIDGVLSLSEDDTDAEKDEVSLSRGTKHEKGKAVVSRDSSEEDAEMMKYSNNEANTDDETAGVSFLTESNEHEKVEIQVLRDSGSEDSRSTDLHQMSLENVGCKMSKCSTVSKTDGTSSPDQTIHTDEIPKDRKDRRKEIGLSRTIYQIHKNAGGRNTTGNR